MVHYYELVTDPIYHYSYYSSCFSSSGSGSKKAKSSSSQTPSDEIWLDCSLNALTELGFRYDVILSGDSHA